MNLKRKKRNLNNSKTCTESYYEYFQAKKYIN